MNYMRRQQRLALLPALFTWCMNIKVIIAQGILKFPSRKDRLIIYQDNSLKQ